MPEALKAVYDRPIMYRLAVKVGTFHSDFNTDDFMNRVFDAEWAKQSFRQMSKRTHYPGEHRLFIRVNGENKAAASFMLGKGT